MAGRLGMPMLWPVLKIWNSEMCKASARALRIYCPSETTQQIFASIKPLTAGQLGQYNSRTRLLAFSMTALHSGHRFEASRTAIQSLACFRIYARLTE